MDITAISYGLWPILAVIVSAFYFFLRHDPKIDKHLQKFDGPRSFPIVGSILSFLKPNHELISVVQNWQKQYGTRDGCFRVWMANIPYVVISDAVKAEKLLSSTVIIEKSLDYSVFHKWLGLGLLTSGSEKWRPRRKVLTPAFHFKILEEFLDVFNEQANIFVEVLAEKPNERAFDIFPCVARCALDIICETAMGRKLHAQKGEGFEYVKAVYGYADILVKQVLLPWLRVGWLSDILGYGKLERDYLKTLHNFTETVIIERKKERKEELIRKPNNLQKSEEMEDDTPKRRVAFLDLLLDLAETDSSLTDTDVREETDTFMFEGHDTTAASMVWTIFCLALHPEHQKKVQEELDDIFGHDSKRKLTSADVAQMKYLESCIKESLRLYPSVPAVFRSLTEDLDFGNGLIAPKGVRIGVVQILLHRDPKVFPNPDSFNPERFSPENSIGRHPYAFVPFSAGPRNCIGQKFALLEEKIVLAKLLLNYNIESVAKSFEEVKVLPDIILRPMEGIHVKLTRRNLKESSMGIPCF